MFVSASILCLVAFVLIIGLRLAKKTFLSECSQAALVDPGLYVAVADAFEINHRRCDVAVSHPLLQGSDVDPVLEVPRGICVAEFVKEPAATVRSFSAAIDLYVPFSSLWLTVQ